MSLYPFDWHPCWGTRAHKMSLCNHETLTEDVSFHSRPQHAEERTRVYVHATPIRRPCIVFPPCQIVRQGTVLPAVGRAGLACVCVCVCHRPLKSFTSSMDLSFPSKTFTSLFPVHTHTHTQSALPFAPSLSIYLTPLSSLSLLSLPLYTAGMPSSSFPSLINLYISSVLSKTK